jgi:hypothetical protein
MAKIRRVVRKVAAKSGDYFDEHLWPVYIALVVLGGFLMGISAAYLQFSGVPWYANAWTSLVLIPLVVVGFMAAFRLVDNRLVRRSMQLSVVLCSILHVALVVQMVETQLFSGLFERPAEQPEIVERRPRRTIPEYHPTQLLPQEDRPRQDFERPLETRTPEPERQPDQIVRQPTPDQPQTPPEPQPVPVPENVPTTEPNVVRQSQRNQAAPRQAEQASRLSRQVQPSDLKISQLIEPVPTLPTPSAGIEARAAASPVERRASDAPQAARASPDEPTTAETQTDPQVSRRTAETSPVVETTLQPTLRRQVTQPAATPRTQVAAVDAPSPARQTSPTAVSPANTESVRRATTSPEVVRARAEPTPQVTSDPAARPMRREHPAPAQPAIAQTPSPVPNRQPRTTARPDVATTAAAAAPAPSPTADAGVVIEPSSAASRVERAATQVTAAQPSAMPAAEPRSGDRSQPALSMVRTQGREGPTASTNPTAAPTLTRRSGAPSLPRTAPVAEAAEGTIVATSRPGEVSPTSTATRRQATESEVVAPATGEPTPAQVASAATQPTATPTLIRRSASGSSAIDAPVIAPQAGAVATTSRSTASAVTNVVTTVGDVPANAGPVTAGVANPGPSTATISRQTAAASSGADRTQPPLAVQAASPASQLARGGAERAESNTTPTIDPSGAAAGSPRRALAEAATASSPVAVESPSASVAATGTGDPSAQPAQLALTRSQAGTAGAGRSPNVDSSLPGAASPALTASGAARRAEATQNTPQGDALSPASPAAIARAIAGADSPTSSLLAEAAETGTIGGANQLADVSASASAALTRSDAAARSGPITATKGTGEVDLGPTQQIAEAGMGRASGGGQTELNFQAQAADVARTQPGGAPLMALATAETGPVAAPAGTAGGQPAATEPGPAAVAAVRTVAGGEATASGGPSKADVQGPLAEANTAALLAESSLSRNDNTAGRSGGDAAAGEPGIEDEEEKARRLARAALGGGPQLAIAGPVAVDIPGSPMGEAGDGGAPAATPSAAATVLATARMSRDGGAPAGGAPLAAGDPGEGGRSGAEAVGALTIARAEATDGAPGAPILGGGTASPARAAAGPTIAASTTAEAVALAGAPASSGAADGAPLEAQGLEAARLAGGVAGPAATEPIGALAGPEVVDARQPGAVGDAPGRRQASPAADDGPALGGLSSSGAPGRQAAAAQLSGGSTLVAAIPEVGPMSAVAQAEADHMLGGMGDVPMVRQASDALAVNIEAPAGPGGVGAEFTPAVGINTRQARQESLNVQLRSARFVKTNVGGLPSVSTTAIEATGAFAARAVRNRGEQPGGGRGAPPPQTEEAIERGLAFLARYQLPDGGWSLQGFPEDAQLATDTAATALAVLAFQGAGFNHREHHYKDVVRGGLDFLVKSQKENGDLFVPLDDDSNRSVWLYSHSLAALALCEAYGMTQDPELKAPAQKALDFIIASQHPDRGGWRYSPGVGSDTSVTGWMMMALKSGELAGLSVPPATYEKIERWLDDSRQSPREPHLFRYNPYAPDTAEQRHGRAASKTMTAVGLLMRLYTGWRRDNANLAAGADFLQQNLPAIGTPRDPQRDTYYWYYGTQVMFHMGGEHWRAWNSRLHPLLTGTQLRAGPLAGSWDPKGPVPDRWGPHGGRLYVTTLNLLSLEVYYRHLPLYEDTAR